jgi:hypothetical protein
MGGKSKSTIGYWYKPLFHHGLCEGPIDAFIEFRAGDKTAWSGLLTASGRISINKADLFGGETDQGGVVGSLDVMFGEAAQQPNDFLLAQLGEQVPAWRGLASVVWRGGRYGAMSAYPQAAAYKVTRILGNWDGGEPWYPETARILIGTVIVPVPGLETLAWSLDTTGGLTTQTDSFTFTGDGDTTLTVELTLSGRIEYRAYSDGVHVVDEAFPQIITASSNAASTHASDNVYSLAVSDPAQTYYLNYVEAADLVQEALVFSGQKLIIEAANNATITVVANPVDALQNGPAPQYIDIAATATSASSTLCSMNLAHVLYQAETDPGMGRELVANIDDASWRTGADWFYANGFGICTTRDPSSESVFDFIERVEKVGACSSTRSLVDGKLYLDIANGVYTLADLPILTDDDVLDFSEQPTTLGIATNSVSIKYFDVDAKESVTTPPTQALDLIDAYGLVHDVVEYPEIPSATLAMRVAARELLSAATPVRAFDLKVMPGVATGLRPMTYVRLQCTKRGIADMVCLVATKEEGSLKSGAISLQLTEDVYSLPQTVNIAIDPGAGQGGAADPVAIVVQRAIEAPYVDLAGSLSSADLKNLAADACYVEAVAIAPAGGLSYDMQTQPDGGSYASQATGQWCPSALIVEADDTKVATTFTLASASGMGAAVVGGAAMWGDEIVRVDAVTPVGAGYQVTLARGCADTVPQLHGAGERIWIYDTFAAADATEYTADELVDVKLLTRAANALLSADDATAMSVTVQGRASLPYAPGQVKIAAADWPSTVAGGFDLTWAHRNRVLQADQIIDTTEATFTQPDNQRYGLRFKDAGGAVLVERDDIGPGAATASLVYTGNVTMELWTVGDVGQSWQRHVHVFAYTPASPPPALSTITATAYTPVYTGTIIDGGDLDG